MAFSTDDWMIRLFGHHMPRELFTQRLIVCETMVLELALKLAARGVDTVIDHGFWRRESRDSARAFLARAQADVVLVYFDVPTSVLKERLRARNTDLPEGTFEITEEMFEQFSTWFEAPGPDEGAVIVRSTS
jgi:predicted kinase